MDLTWLYAPIVYIGALFAWVLYFGGWDSIKDWSQKRKEKKEEKREMVDIRRFNPWADGGRGAWRTETKERLPAKLDGSGFKGLVIEREKQEEAKKRRPLSDLSEKLRELIKENEEEILKYLTTIRVATENRATYDKDIEYRLQNKVDNVDLLWKFAELESPTVKFYGKSISHSGSTVSINYTKSYRMVITQDMMNDNVVSTLLHMDRSGLRPVQYMTRLFTDDSLFAIAITSKNDTVEFFGRPINTYTAYRFVIVARKLPLIDTGGELKSVRLKDGKTVYMIDELYEELKEDGGRDRPEQSSPSPREPDAHGQ